MDNKRKVAYYYDAEIGSYYYGNRHPMKPHRVRMANDLIVRYGLYKHLQIFKPMLATTEDFLAFHDRSYLGLLELASDPLLAKDISQNDMQRFHLGHDCPVFEGMYRYCQLYAGGSLGGAVRLNYGHADIAINWAGGLHHAKKGEASGFCYVNDIVLSILELLKYHQRVLYIDIDVHHGDGVEEAFFTTDRVLTCSFHKFGHDFFPGTGDLDDVGGGQGRNYSVNVPLNDGMDDASYRDLFQPIMREVMARYQPDVVVLQSGADSLTGDRLGRFNLTIKGHAACHKFMASFGKPMLVLGGGGYKIKNVARCWTYETAVLLGMDKDLPEQLPPNEYYEYFGPEYALHIHPDPERKNRNSRDELQQILTTVLANLSHIQPAGAQFKDRDAAALQTLSDPKAAKQAAAQRRALSPAAQQLWDGDEADADAD